MDEYEIRGLNLDVLYNGPNIKQLEKSHAEQSPFFQCPPVSDGVRFTTDSGFEHVSAQQTEEAITIHRVLNNNLKKYGVDVPEFDSRRVFIESNSDAGSYLPNGGYVMHIGGDRFGKTYAHEALHWGSVHKKVSYEPKVRIPSKEYVRVETGCRVYPKGSSEGVRLAWLDEALVSEKNIEINVEAGSQSPIETVYTGELDVDRTNYILGINNTAATRRVGDYPGEIQYSRGPGTLLRTLVQTLHTHFADSVKSANIREQLHKKGLIASPSQLLQPKDMLELLHHGVFSIQNHDTTDMLLKTVFDDHALEIFLEHSEVVNTIMVHGAQQHVPGETKSDSILDLGIPSEVWDSARKLNELIKNANQEINT